MYRYHDIKQINKLTLLLLIFQVLSTTTNSETPTSTIETIVNTKNEDDSHIDVYNLGGINKGDIEPETPKPTFNLIWKVSVTRTTTVKTDIISAKDHGLVMDALQRTMQDFEYRYMWLSLMKNNYTLFLKELIFQGPETFFKPKEYSHDRDVFKGPDGRKRWKFLLDYFKDFNVRDFERILELFDHNNNIYQAITFRTYSSPPLPSNYWELTKPGFDWKKYDEEKANATETDYVTPYTTTEDYFKKYMPTHDEDATFINPWDYTLPVHLFKSDIPADWMFKNITIRPEPWKVETTQKPSIVDIMNMNPWNYTMPPDFFNNLPPDKKRMYDRMKDGHK